MCFCFPPVTSAQQLQRSQGLAPPDFWKCHLLVLLQSKGNRKHSSQFRHKKNVQDFLFIPFGRCFISFFSQKFSQSRNQEVSKSKLWLSFWIRSWDLLMKKGKGDKKKLFPLLSAARKHCLKLLVLKISSSFWWDSKEIFIFCSFNLFYLNLLSPMRN